MNEFLLALKFLTRIPTPINIDHSPASLGRSVLYYPIIGGIIGFILFSIAQLLSDVEPNLAAALILTLWVGLTGGLHLDGISDCVDGWIGGQGNIEKSLSIMKDPNAGPMGVTALILLLLIKYSALSILLSHGAFTILLIAPIVGRASVLFLMLSTPYIRPNGLANMMNKHLSRKLASIILILSLVIATFSINIILVVALIASALFIRAYFMRVFGGTTGDMYGASIELIELATLLTGACLMPYVQY